MMAGQRLWRSAVQSLLTIRRDRLARRPLRRESFKHFEFARAAEVMEARALLSAPAYGTGFSAQWAQYGGTTQASSGVVGGHAGLATDSAGNLYVTGFYNGTGNINPLGTPYTLASSQSNQQPFVAKYDANLNLQWVMNPSQYSTTTGSTMQPFSAIAMNSAAGDLYVEGNLLGTMTLPTASGTWSVTASNQTGFIMGLDRNTGNLIWFAEFGPKIQSMATDGAGNLYVQTITSGATTVPWAYLYGPGTGGQPITFSPTTSGLPQGAFVKCDSSGNVLWSGSFSTQNSARVVVDGMAVDSAGNIYFNGLLCQQGATADLDPGPGVKLLTAVNQGDVVIGKIDAQGNLAWVVHNSLTPNQEPESVAVDANGDVDVGFNNPFPYAVSVTVTGKGKNQKTTIVGGDLVQFDNNGNLNWYQQNPYDNSSIFLDPAGNIYLLPGTYSGSPPAIELIKYSSAGHLVWSVPNNGYFIGSMAIDTAGDVWTSINNTGSGQVDVSPTSTPSYLNWNGGLTLVKWTQPGGFAAAAPLTGSTAMLSPSSTGTSSPTTNLPQQPALFIGAVPPPVLPLAPERDLSLELWADGKLLRMAS